VEILLDKNFKVDGENTAFARLMEEQKVDFDVDAFLNSKEEIEDLFPGLDLEWIGVGRAPTFEKSISELVPTKPEMKSDEQVDREKAEIEQELATDKGKVNFRVLKFEEVLQKNDSIDLNRFAKILKDVDPAVITGFVAAMGNEMLLACDAMGKKVFINADAKPEIKIITGQFERWLRFGKL
jgi:hypothetical protein